MLVVSCPLLPRAVTVQDKAEVWNGLEVLRHSAQGQISDFAVQPRLQKYFGSQRTQITGLSLAIPVPLAEGRIAIVTDVGHGMRWTQAVLLTRAL
jgi:hypothetical protein